MKTFLVVMRGRALINPQTSLAEGAEIRGFEFYEVHTTNPDDVTVPLDTILFVFCKSESKEELIKNITYFNIPLYRNAANLVVPKIFTDNAPIYIIGKEIKCGDTRMVINSRTRIMSYITDDMVAYE